MSKVNASPRPTSVQGFATMMADHQSPGNRLAGRSFAHSSLKLVPVAGVEPATPIVLNSAARAVLASLSRRGPYVVPGSAPNRPRADLNKPWRLVPGRVELAGVRLHDLRHTFASIGAGASLGLPIVGKLLGHAQPQTTARYAHLDADPLRRASDLIGDKLAAALQGATKLSASGSVPTKPKIVDRRPKGPNSAFEGPY